MKIIQAGMGLWGRDWATAVVPTVPGVEQVAFVDESPEALATLRDAYPTANGRTFASLGAALEAVEADGVLVTCSLPGHATLTRLALEAGKHVLVEKPFVATVEEGRDLVEEAERRGLVLMVSQNYRHFPAVRAVQELISERALGELGEVSVEFGQFANIDAIGRQPFHTLDQPLLVDMSIHHLDLVRAVVPGDVAQVHCRLWNPGWSQFQGPAAGQLVAVCDDGVVVRYHGSWVHTGEPTGFGGLWRMQCEQGEIAWASRLGADESADGDWVEVRRLGQAPERVALPHLEHLGRAGCLAEFAAAVRAGGTPVETSGRDNLGSLAFLAAALESAGSGRTEPLVTA